LPPAHQILSVGGLLARQLAPQKFQKCPSAKSGDKVVAM
jgi:hypothetical protein